MAIRLSTVRRKFPEARELPAANGAKFCCHCPQPHRKGPRNFKLFIYADNGHFVCQDCGYEGFADKEWPDAFNGVSEHFAHLALEPVEDELEGDINAVRARTADEWENGVPSPGRLVPFAQLPDDHVAVEYLAQRGLDVDEIRDFAPGRALFYCPKGGYTRGGGTNGGRIVLPIYMNGMLKGWQARQIEHVVHGPSAPLLRDHVPWKEVWNGESWDRFGFNARADKFQDEVRGIPKYNTSAGCQRSSCLFSFDAARQFPAVVLVEGPLDVLSVGPEAVATMGGNGGASVAQIRLLQAYWGQVVILPDPSVALDPKAQRSQSRLLEALSPTPTVVVPLPGGKDPGGTPRAVVWETINQTLEKQL